MCQCPDSPRVFRAFIHQNLQLEGLQVLENTFCQPNVHLSRVVLGQTRAASTDASSQLQVTWPCQDQYPVLSPRTDLGGPIGGQCWAASSNQRPGLLSILTTTGSPGGCGDTALTVLIRDQSRDQTENKSTESVSHSYLNVSMKKAIQWRNSENKQTKTEMRLKQVKVSRTDQLFMGFFNLFAFITVNF